MALYGSVEVYDKYMKIYVHITLDCLHFKLTFWPIYKALRCHLSVTFSFSTPHETMHKTRADNCFTVQYSILNIVAYFIL